MHTLTKQKFPNSNDKTYKQSLVYSFQCYTNRNNSSTDWTKPIAMNVLCKPVVTVTTCSMTARMKCCPFTIFGYFIKTYRTGYSGRFFFIFLIYFSKLDSKLLIHELWTITHGPEVINSIYRLFDGREPRVYLGYNIAIET